MFYVIKSLDVFLTWSSDVLTLIIGEMFKTFYVRANNHLNYAHKLKSCRSIWIIDASAILSWQGHKTSQEYSLRVNAFTILRKFAKRVFLFPWLFISSLQMLFLASSYSAFFNCSNFNEIQNDA